MLKRLSTSLADRSLMAKGLWVVLIPLAPLVLTSTLIYIVQSFQNDAAATVVRSREVENELHILLGLLDDAEAGKRAYLLTGDESWLQAVRPVHEGVPAILQRLDGLMTDTGQRGRLTRMPSLIERRLAVLDEVVDEARMLGRFPAAVPPSRLEQGRQLMTVVRAETTAMFARQRELLAVRTARAQRMGQILLVVAGAGAAVGVAGGVVAVMIFTVGISSRVRVLNESIDCLVHGMPVQAPPGGRDEIGVLGGQLHQAAALLAVRDRELHRAHDTLDRFFTLSLDMLCIAGMDGYFKRLSPAFNQALGYTTDELLARPFLDFVHPDDRAATLSEMEKLSRGVPTISFENRYQCRDGSWRWLSWKTQPVAEEGVLYATARDITARKQTEEALKENEQRLSLALDSGEMGAWELDLVHDAAIRTLKHDEIFGYQSLQPQWGAEIFMGHVFPEDRQVVRNAFDEAFANDRLRFECRIIWKDQSLHWIAARGLVYRDREGAPLRMLGVVMDITKRKQAEEQIRQLNTDLHVRAVELAEANKELESFSYSVSHDLRAPLRSIDGFSQILLEDYADHLDEEGKDALQRVRKAATGMGQLIDALLALGRVSRVDLRAERVDLSALAATLAAELRQSQPDRQAEFVIARDLIVEGDRTLLRAALGNLLGNAWKYTQPRATARIEFGCLEKDSETAYFVRDNGVGFDMTYVDKLFGAFQRLHRQTEFGGTGVGLATVKRIMHRHGGRAWAEGAVDQGATFYFTLHSPARSHMAAWEKADARASVS